MNINVERTLQHKRDEYKHNTTPDGATQDKTKIRVANTTTKSQNWATFDPCAAHQKTLGAVVC